MHVFTVINLYEVHIFLVEFQSQQRINNIGFKRKELEFVYINIRDEHITLLHPRSKIGSL